MLPIICIVGKSGSGKTALVERIIPELKRRGYRVASIKHNPHDFELDQPGKDSWRHAQAGSDAVVISSPQKVALIKGVEHDPTLGELLRLIGNDFDIVIAEGFKESEAPKIEVHRAELGEGLVCKPDELLAVATDEELGLPVLQCPLDDTPGLANLIEERFLAHREREEVILFVNGERVPLSPFPRDFLYKTLLGMVSALKGAENVESLDIWLRKQA